MSSALGFSRPTSPALERLGNYKPLWDSGVRDALHQAAKLEEFDFKGFGFHSFRGSPHFPTRQVGHRLTAAF